MTGFDVIPVTTLSEEILSLIVWASALCGSSLAVLGMAKWWGPRDGDEVAKAVSAARQKAARSAGASAPRKPTIRGRKTRTTEARDNRRGKVSD